MSLWNLIKYWLADGENKPKGEEKKIIAKTDKIIKTISKQDLNKINVFVVRDPIDQLWPFMDIKWKDYRHKVKIRDTLYSVKPAPYDEGYAGAWLEDQELMVVNRAGSRGDIEDFIRIYIKERLRSCDFVPAARLSVWETDVYKRLK